MYTIGGSQEEKEKATREKNEMHLKCGVALRRGRERDGSKFVSLPQAFPVSSFFFSFRRVLCVFSSTNPPIHTRCDHTKRPAATTNGE